MKQELTVLPLNLQQGLFLNDTNQIIAAYSHHRRVIYMCAPWQVQDFAFPENYKDYSFKRKFTDCFSIAYWDHNTNATELLS